jgi:hypothetical protein
VPGRVQSERYQCQEAGVRSVAVGADQLHRRHRDHHHDHRDRVVCWQGQQAGGHCRAAGRAEDALTGSRKRGVRVWPHDAHASCGHPCPVGDADRSSRGGRGHRRARQKSGVAARLWPRGGEPTQIQRGRPVLSALEGTVANEVNERRPPGSRGQQDPVSQRLRRRSVTPIEASSMHSADIAAVNRNGPPATSPTARGTAHAPHATTNSHSAPPAANPYPSRDPERHGRDDTHPQAQWPGVGYVADRPQIRAQCQRDARTGICQRERDRQRGRNRYRGEQRRPDRARPNLNCSHSCQATLPLIVGLNVGGLLVSGAGVPGALLTMGAVVCAVGLLTVLSKPVRHAAIRLPRRSWGGLARPGARRPWLADVLR